VKEQQPRKVGVQLGVLVEIGLGEQLLGAELPRHGEKLGDRVRQAVGGEEEIERVALGAIGKVRHAPDDHLVKRVTLTEPHRLPREREERGCNL